MKCNAELNPRDKENLRGQFFIRQRFMLKLMTCSDVQTLQTKFPSKKLEYLNSKNFKPISILKIYSHYLLQKLLNSPPHPLLKPFNLPDLNDVINTNLNTQV